MIQRSILAAVIAVGLGVSSAAYAEVTLIRAGRVIVDPGKPALDASTVVVRDGRIVTVVAGHSGGAPADVKPGEPVREIDARTRTVLPGLIDSHVHLSSDPGSAWWLGAVVSDEYQTLVGVKNAGITVRAGFTTVRDVGSGPQVGFALRDGVRSGLFPGPRILSSGPAISIIGGHGDVTGFRREVLTVLAAGNTCTGAEECAAKVREASRAGADLIKITATGGVLSQQARGLDKHFTQVELNAIVGTAKTLGLRVAAHAHGPRGIEMASIAGVSSIEHGTFADDAGLKAMKANAVYMVPTLMAFTGLRERIGKNIYTPQVEAKAKEALAQLGKAMSAAKRLSVPIAFGTDAGVFEHGRNAEEFAMMVELGKLSPAEALASATTGAAALLGLSDQIGTLEAGKVADIIAVDGDPLSDPKALERVRFVMAAGKVVRVDP
jgi:imidazolonepropionase-like amidohydrolase